MMEVTRAHDWKAVLGPQSSRRPCLPSAPRTPGSQQTLQAPRRTSHIAHFRETPHARLAKREADLEVRKMYLVRHQCLSGLSDLNTHCSCTMACLLASPISRIEQHLKGHASRYQDEITF
jgi:hypothetical protein